MGSKNFGRSSSIRSFAIDLALLTCYRCGSLRADVAASKAVADAAQSAQTALEQSLLVAEENVASLTTALAAETEKLQGREVALASEGARCTLLDHRAKVSAGQESAIRRRWEACEASAAEQRAELSASHTQRDRLAADVLTRSERLLELEQVVASLNAAAYIVDTARNRSMPGMTATSSDRASGGGVETCTASVGAEGKERHLCLKVQSPSYLSSSPPPPSAPSSLLWRRNTFTSSSVVDGGNEIGLLAIAGAVAAVWVFLIALEKMKQPS